MTIVQMRKRAARRAIRRGVPVFVSYAHRPNRPGAPCNCNECRWVRHQENACPDCGGDGYDPDFANGLNMTVPCHRCGGCGLAEGF